MSVCCYIAISGFDKESTAKKKKHFWSSFLSTGVAAVTSTFKRMLIEIEARNAIIDKVVHTTRVHAYTEFRMAHPPLFPCTRDHCYECFPNATKLQFHLQSEAVHGALEAEYAEISSRFEAVDKAFNDAQGRRLAVSSLTRYPKS